LEKPVKLEIPLLGGELWSLPPKRGIICAIIKYVDLS